MNESILASVKSLLGLPVEYCAFDSQLIIYINTALAILAQIGVGPVNGFFITCEEQYWSDFLQYEDLISMVRTYVYLRVFILFDNTLNSSVVEALKSQAAELEWRLRVDVESRIRKEERGE